MKKIYKTVDGITLYGSNRWVEIRSIFDGNDSSFYHYGRRYRLSQFMRCDSHIHLSDSDVNKPGFMSEFDGYHSDSFFSGVVVKLSDENTLKAFTYIG